MYKTEIDPFFHKRAIDTYPKRSSNNSLDVVSKACETRVGEGNTSQIAIDSRLDRTVDNIADLKLLPRNKTQHAAPRKQIRRKTTTEPISWTRAMMLLAAMRDKSLAHDNIRLMLACGFYLGLRIGDILQLRYEQLVGEELIIHEQKTGKERRIFLNGGFKDIVDQVVSNMSFTPTGYVFVYNRRGQDKNTPISVTSANKRIRKVFTHYEIACKNPSSHCLRKTFGKHVFELMGKTDEALLILSEIFNHQGNLHVTKKYIGILDEQVQDVYRNL